MLGRTFQLLLKHKRRNTNSGASCCAITIWLRSVSGISQPCEINIITADLLCEKRISHYLKKCTNIAQIIHRSGSKRPFCCTHPAQVFEILFQGREWLGREDSNLRMSIPKTDALPLGDAPTGLWRGFNQTAPTCKDLFLRFVGIFPICRASGATPGA